jgi:hypothetical protein
MGVAVASITDLGGVIHTGGAQVLTWFVDFVCGTLVRTHTLNRPLLSGGLMSCSVIC